MDLLTAESIIKLLIIAATLIFVLLLAVFGMFILALIGAGIAEQKSNYIDKKEGGRK